MYENLGALLQPLSRKPYDCKSGLVDLVDREFTFSEIPTTQPLKAWNDLNLIQARESARARIEIHGNTVIVPETGKKLPV
jgi:hypothetical protein